MRAPGLRMHPLERRDADDVDPPVVAILEAQDFDPRDERVADDEMELAADQLGGALRPHPRRKADFTALGARRDPGRECGIIAATDGDAGHVKLGHDREMGSRCEKARRTEERREGNKWVSTG